MQIGGQPGILAAQMPQFLHFEKHPADLYGRKSAPEKRRVDLPLAESEVFTFNARMPFICFISIEFM